jgi:hypothetical protein
MRPSLVLKCLAMVLWGFGSSCASAGPAPWASSDYVDLYFRVYNGQVPLPHLRDARQKTLFTHLIDPENLLYLQSAAVPQGEKQRQLEIILATLSALRSRYNGAIIVGEPLAQELALVQAYELQAMGSLAKLSPQDAKGDVSHPAWTTLIGGVIDDVENSKTYSPQQSAILADALARNYPAIAVALSAGDRSLVRAEALKLGDAGGNAVLKDARQQIRKSVLQ